METIKTTQAVKLEPLDFYRLQAAQGEVSKETLKQLHLQLQLQRAQEDVRNAVEKKNAVLTQLAERYGFSPDTPWQFDETTHTLRPANG
jgi:hypothetical protein